jgi:signal transduction histidine kinase
MIPIGSISNLRHSLANRLIPCTMLLEVEDTAEFSAESMSHIEDGAALLDEMMRLISDFAATGADAAVPMRQTERTLHRLSGCIAPARAHFELARTSQRDKAAQSLLDEIDQGLESVGTIVADFRAEWFTGSKQSLRDVVARAVAATGDGSHIEVKLSDHSVFDDLTGNRFIREFLDEALINARKHGKGVVKLTGNFVNDEAVIRITDTGPGFDPDTVKHGHGMRVLTNSAVALGGSVAIESNPSSVTLRFPVE